MSDQPKPCYDIRWERTQWVLRGPNNKILGRSKDRSWLLWQRAERTARAQSVREQVPVVIRLHSKDEPTLERRHEWTPESAAEHDAAIADICRRALASANASAKGGSE